VTARALLAAVAAALLAACGDTLVDHNGVGILTNAASCGDGQVTCNGVCTTQSTAACGAACVECPGAPLNATESCTPTGPGGHDGVCGYACDDGLLRCATGCCAPALVAAGGQFSCAATSVAEGGQVHCFGAGDQGELGNGGTVDRPTSAELRGIPAPGASTLVAGGAHACAIVGATTRCWGNGAAFGVAGSVLDPEIVPALANATALAAGKSHTCAIVGTQVVCVGVDGLSGGGSPTLGGTPLAIAAGDRFSCALVSTGTGNLVKCWGVDDYGQLGDGLSGNATATPQTVGSGVLAADVLHLGAGDRHACAGTETPPAGGGGNATTMWCWGDNTSRQLGKDALGGTHEPPTGNSGVKKPVRALSGGGHATCSIYDDAAFILACWSSDPVVAGGGIFTGEPNPLVSMPNTGSLWSFSSGNAHNCFVDPSLSPARLKCFGSDGRGQLGNGTPLSNSNTPVLVLDR
jgi:hypothetical protein